MNNNTSQTTYFSEHSNSRSFTISNNNTQSSILILSIFRPKSDQFQIEIDQCDLMISAALNSINLLQQEIDQINFYYKIQKQNDATIEKQKRRFHSFLNFQFQQHKKTQNNEYRIGEMLNCKSKFKIFEMKIFETQLLTNGLKIVKYSTKQIDCEIKKLTNEMQVDIKQELYQLQLKNEVLMKKCICFRNGIENVMENKDKLYLMEDLDNMRKCWIDLMIEYEILENERKNCYKQVEQQAIQLNLLQKQLNDKFNDMRKIRIKINHEFSDIRQILNEHQNRTQHKKKWQHQFKLQMIN